MQQKSDRPMR